jgi:hypothetical protein
MGYQYGMTFSDQKEPSYNSCVFATRKEAEGAAKELMSRWFVPTGWIVIEVDKKVNYEFKDRVLNPLQREVTWNS